MAIKLLAKRDIDAAKAKERSLEVAEGLKLANRVDGLRETQAQEEASLQRFRTETIKKINEEITESTAKRDSLLTEVKTLQADRERALIPLDKEKQEIVEERVELEEKHSLNKAFEETLEKKERLSMCIREHMTYLKKQVHLRVHQNGLLGGQTTPSEKPSKNLPSFLPLQRKKKSLLKTVRTQCSRKKKSCGKKK